MWAGYTRLPAGMPPSGIHVRVAKAIVDTVESLDEDEAWFKRFSIASARSVDRALGPTLEAQGLALEAFRLTALHRRKKPGDERKTRDLLKRMRELDRQLGGSMQYEIAWREARLLAQLDKLPDAVDLYVNILEHGASNISRSASELAIEALAVSAAKRSGRFRTVLKLARQHNAMFASVDPEAARSIATRIFETEFCNPFPPTL